MNNDQFRRLLFENSKASNGSPSSSSSPASADKPRNAATPTSLGSRMRSSIPMTPRSVGGSSGIDFARQLREANTQQDGRQTKKFRSAPAPKGSRLAAGYVDRARLRDGDGDGSAENDIAKRIKSLEEMVKLGQMQQEDFERARDEIVGGDVKNVHLVKGLDRRLLERARRGEDVFSAPAVVEVSKAAEVEEDIDVDGALDEMEARDVVPTVRTKHVDDTSAVAGKKRTRNDILKELKEARQQAALSQQPQQLGSKFKKVVEQLKPGTSRLEIDEKCREVLVVVDMDGNVKRKVKKAKAVSTPIINDGPIQQGRTSAAPLGSDVVVPARPQSPSEPEEEQDLFADAGTDYNPLKGMEDSDSGSGSESGEEKPKQETKTANTNMLPPPAPRQSNGSRNYFNDKPKEEVETISNPANDPEFLAALRKAANVADRMDKSGDMEQDEEKLKKLAKHKQMLAADDRDAEDMDFGFGTSRFDDQEDGEDRFVKLSKWTGGGGQGDDSKKGSNDQGKRKRGAKKRKGDKNSATDVLAVLERRAKT